jgi:hypothetical protein
MSGNESMSLASVRDNLQRRFPNDSVSVGCIMWSTSDAGCYQDWQASVHRVGPGIIRHTCGLRSAEALLALFETWNPINKTTDVVVEASEVTP